jgi:hypothetical protein
VIEAEFQAALNALTEHKLQVASKNGRSAAWKGTTSRVMMAGRPKVSFWPDGSTSCGNYEYKW